MTYAEMWELDRLLEEASTLPNMASRVTEMRAELSSHLSMARQTPRTCGWCFQPNRDSHPAFCQDCIDTARNRQRGTHGA